MSLEPGSATPDAAPLARDLYLDLLERCLLNTIYEDAYTDWQERGVEKKFNPVARHLGRDWPKVAHTMIGQVRLRNLRDLTEQVLADGIPGDFIETGVWRGGACILMRAVLKSHGVADRRVFVADSFEGLPKPNVVAYPADAGDVHHTHEELAVSLEQVKANFARYGLLDEQVVFVKGWFKDTLPSLPADRLALARLDGDMYESTMDALRNLYDKLSPGGFLIIDDYGCIDGCRKATEDFRRERGITEPIVDIDGWGVYWRKPKDAVAAPTAVQRLEPLADGGPRPFWSVLVPLYERQAYLKQCLDSILGQDPGRGDMEILVVDDGSPNDLRGFVADLGRGRVRYLRHSTNLGTYPSLNVGIRQARGRWLHIVPDDDWIQPGFYATFRRALEVAPSAGVAFCRHTQWDERTGKSWSPPPFRDSAGLLDRGFLTRLVTQNLLAQPAVVYRRETFERVGLFREDLAYTADWEWYVRGALATAWHYQPEVLACFRVHAGNQALELVRSGRMVRDVRRTLDLFAGHLPPDVANHALPASRQYHAQQFLSTALGCLQAGNQGLAGRFLVEALTLDANAPGRPEFAQLLQLAAFPSLRQEVRAALLRRFG